jgi:DNA gyrase subunit A
MPRTSRGRALVNLLNLQPGERICEFMPIVDFEKGEDYLLFATANGLVKRSALADYRNVNSSGLIAVNLREGDALVGVIYSTGNDHVLLGTSTGMAIRFDENDVRVMGRNASGVKGISLAKGDRVVGVVKIGEGSECDLLTVTTAGYGKRTPTQEYLVQSESGETRVQGRGGKGRRDMNVKDSQVVTLKCVSDADDLMLITHDGMIVRINAGTVRQTHRQSQGVRVINLGKDDKLVALARVAEDETDDGTPSNPVDDDTPPQVNDVEAT